MHNDNGEIISGVIEFYISLQTNLQTIIKR